MNMKKILSIFLAIVLLVGVIAPSIPVKAETPHQHTYGQWTFDTAKASQSRTCSGCSDVQTLYGTTNKMEQVKNPAIGGTYYLAANVNGTLRYFYLSGSVGATSPASLNTTEDIGSAKQVTLAVEPTADTGDFRLSYDNNGTANYIYANGSFAGDNQLATGTGAKNLTADKNAFSMDTVDGVSVIREYSTSGTNGILAVQELTHVNGTTKTYRIQGVAESKLGTEGVYPVMLLTNHTHSFGTEAGTNATHHWNECDCGFQSDKAEHTFEWTFDTAKGTQSKTCTACHYVTQTLHGTTNKAEQVTAPAIGSTYYLAANVAGKLKYFYLSGAVTATNPYSLNTTEDPARAKPVTLATAVEAGKGEFQLDYDDNGTARVIYCIPTGTYNTGTTSKYASNGTSYGSYYTANRATFSMDEVNGVKVLRKYSNNAVLAVKQLTHVNGTTVSYRMVGVAENELANEGVYPVMLVTNHTHTAGTKYGFGETQHWQLCDCGDIATEKVSHTFVEGKCVCGAENTQHECKSTDNVWYDGGEQHYQLCGTCGEEINKAAHTYSGWTVDTTKGTQSKLCTACNHVGETLYGTTDKVSKVETPTVGSEYYLVVNIDGEIRSFITGSYTQTTPYSIITGTTLNKVEVQAALEAGKGEFQIVYNDGTNDYPVYSVTAGVGLSKSASYVSDPNKVSFSMDTVNGVAVLRAYGTGKILAAKYSEAKSQWRIFPVEDSEIGTAGVYPVMLATLHTHTYGTAYEQGETQHWQVCDCGATSPKVDHDFTNGDCVCGKENTIHECQSTDGKWYDGGEQHYQKCGTCGEEINKTAHTYSGWTVDTAKGIRRKLCTACNHVGDTFHGNDTVVSQVTAPTVGSEYYMVVNVDGDIRSFITGSYTQTTPYSIITSETLNKVTVAAALQAGQGEFQLVHGGEFLVYSVAAGVGLSRSASYVTDPAKVSFSMDTVNGEAVLRAYGTGKILAAKYSDAKAQWRIYPVEDNEIGLNGVYPVMLATLHTHTPGSFQKNDEQHWKICSACDMKVDLADHVYVKNPDGQRVCECGQIAPLHVCQSADGKWFSEDNKHYQVCGVCFERIKVGEHTLGNWVFDTAKGTQSKFCSGCQLAVETLYGTETKGYQVTAPQVGQSYYLAANVDGKLQFFKIGTYTSTKPYSLPVTEDTGAANKITLMATAAATAGEFKLTYNQNGDKAIYCADMTSDGIMDTSATSVGNTNHDIPAKTTYIMDEVNGITVIRKTENNNVLVVKYDPMVDAYRMLGVPETELGKDGIYPAMLMNLHEHTHTNTTYQKDALGHWFACECGGKSDYADHTVSKWTYTKKPTQTSGGQKTGTCTTCGGKAVVDVPAMVAEGHYYLTGTLGGKTYYFRPQTGAESVEDTAPFSLMSTTKEKEAMKVNVVWDEKSNTYVLNFTETRTLNIYMDDVNGNTVKQDGKVDLSASATTAENRILFRWDSVNKRFFQIENGERYVMAFKNMTFQDGKTQAVRMLAVPETELSATTVPVQLKTVHIHDFSSKWSGDALKHYHACSCGMHKDEADHEVTKWTVEKKATTSAAGKKSGICAGCGMKVVQAIPMLTDKIKAPENGGIYYLTGTLNGQQHYFSHTPSGGSVADTYPYSLYTDPGTGVVTPVKVLEKKDNYKLSYVLSDIYLYISGDGVGMTSKVENSALVDYQWDEDYKVLYQMEGNAKHVLVIKMLRNADGKTLPRITSMPLDQALIDPNVAIVRLTTQAPDATGLGAPKDATMLDEVSDTGTGEETPNDQTGSVLERADSGKSLTKLFVAAGVIVVLIPAMVLLLVSLKNTAFGLAIFGKRHVWAGACVIAAGVVIAGAMLLPQVLGPKAPGVAKFTIVANETSMEEAKALAVEIYEDHGVSLPVVDVNDFDGDYGIYLNVTGFNSYGGYKYQIVNREDENGTGVYLDGTGYALETAISKWVRSLKKNPGFPFGMEEKTIGYEWNTGDVNMTALGFTMEEEIRREIYEGVELRELKYNSFAYGKNNAYAIIVDSDAPVELKVSAGEWDENTTPDNPGKKYTVQKHGKRLTDAGYEVLAITNAGFYDLNTVMTYRPWGMQIVDGTVKKAPNKDNPKNTDNWFGQTADGKFVISNTDGYPEYETKISDGVGGGLMIMKDGKPCFSGTTPDYRTVVGITKDGDLVMLTISGANYAVVAQTFMDMGLEMDSVLNLDGGGSTTLHTLTEEGKLKQFICETPVEREVADAIAIVKKK